MRHIVEERPDAATGLAAGRFDLDDVGAEAAEQLAAKLAGLIGEFDDPEAGQRARERVELAHRSISSM
jgi:hypothetical protein